MKFAALALDYDGTIAVDGRFDPAVRDAVADARRRGIVVMLVTGRRLEDLRRVAGDLAWFDAIVAENGAVLEFPLSGRHVVIGHPPRPVFLEGLRRRGVPFIAGESIVEADANHAGAILDAVRSLEQPLILAFNRGRVMVLPQAVAKSTGLRQALLTLRTSIHNTVGIGDAENDHDLLDACEVGVAVGWGSAALRAVADEIVAGNGPNDMAGYIRRLVQQPRLSPAQMGRRRLVLGRQFNGEEVSLAIRGRTIIIAGEPGTGKSWLAGSICEQAILQGYCVCIVDPEGDYRSLEALPGVIVLGGEDPPPQARDLVRALRHPDVSVIVDLSKLSHNDKREYLQMLLPLLVRLRRATGLPHKILLDEAHHFLSGPNYAELMDDEFASYILVTFRVSSLAAGLRTANDLVVMVTNESDPAEIAALLAMCRPQPCATVSPTTFRDLQTTEAALLPGAEEAHGEVRRFQMSPRLTSHVRHRSKYLDMPVAPSQAFVFTRDAKPAARARTLKEFIGLLAALPDDVLLPHLRRHDFSRWIADVFRDRPLAAHLRGVENRVEQDDLPQVTEAIGQAIRARYETALQLTPAVAGV